ncbi:hypothetical protein PILCRDRAFT_366536 [Piloderma croceum F 1598]|uniref:C3H1-type domain-containing protein n=1 Tax=Piloderma croceum (strain F 1598) TaxID=765440 RepID=A0A0C3C745_PILCF|nr:hypothetical protein PILCRDRAFT_366536 [Piloderma croceum F 1598]
MPSRTASSESESSPMEPTSNHSTGTPVNSGRWRFNGTGQFVDSEAASTEWDLADEIVRLNVSGDIGDEVHARMKTPPKSKMPNTAVVQLNETSPLETSSDASADSSPHPSDHQINVAHSRGSSTDSTHESVLSSASQTMQAPSQLKVSPNNEAKERPHSFSGGLSAAELRRLQQAGDANSLQDAANQHQQWSSAHFRDTIGLNDKQFPPEQLTYPSLTNTTVFPRSQQQQFDPRSAQSSAAAAPGNSPHPEDLMADYHLQQRNFSQLSQQALAAAAGGPPAFAAGRPNTNLQYRQPPRGFTPQGMPPNATSLGYPGGHHTPHLSLGNTQQMYDMMHPSLHPDNPHPAVTRVQQQHNVFRPNHQHSASDPSAMRDAATLALLNGNMQAYAPPGPAMYPPGMAPPAMSLYTSQFYGAQEAYPRAADLAAAQAIANRLQPQYTGYGTVDEGPNGNGPSANNRKLGLYKTELCRSWEEKGTCRYGAKCQFAHGEDELRKVARHPKYKTEICRTFWVSGSCPYGKRCCFIHTELPASGAPPGADGAPPPQMPDGRARSLSTNSDPNEQSISLLARISAKRKEDVSGPNSQNSASTPVDVSPPPSGYQFNSRPPTGTLRVDTSVLDSSAGKQNKSAYPTFASNVVVPQNDQASAKSPVPATAGPDLGRHNNSRLEIVGYNQQRVNKPTSTNPNVRHSFNGTEVNLDDFSTPAPAVNTGQSSSLRMSSPDRNSNGASSARANGHSRSGSAGNWGSFSRSSHLATPYPQSSGASGEMKGNSPWSTSELAVGSSRLNEKAWA